ncbi:MAG: ABC-2 type transport system ATP-binding protein [Phycisphaerales bacterium]|jgi:ABC-2 type transport system ATP-binding protein
MECIELKKVSKTYAGARGESDRLAVSPLDLKIESGEFIGLLGPNGSGKSTLLRMLVGMERLSTGEITPPIDRAFRARLGVIFQHPALDAILSVRENLRLAGRLHGLGGEDLATRIASLAKAFGVSDRLDSRVGSLSGGLARRADLARAMISNPEVLVVDEATSSLDQGAREEFISLILSQREQRIMTVVMATHRPEEVRGADRVLVMNHGKIVRRGTPIELIESLGHSELVVRSPSDEVRGLLVAAGLSLIDRPNDVTAYTDRLEPSLISSLHEHGASMSMKPTDLASVYRDAMDEAAEQTTTESTNA